MAKHGKKFTKAAAGFDKLTAYSPAEGISLVKALAFAKFDETIGVSFRLGIDSRKADQLVRGTVGLPHGTGKSVRVAVFAEGEQLAAAEAAGADIVGGKDLAEKIAAGGSLDFDVAIATPGMMAEVGKLGRVLGPRGLMPNPKAGTVTMDITKAVEEFKAGKIEYRNDRFGNVAAPIGRVSFEEAQLLDNLKAVSGEIFRAKPSSSKGSYVRNVALASTMGPGVKLDEGDLEALAFDDA